ncbi:MAG: aliphatic sulfonate ABC transporter substrate-binding protein [Propionibacteriaceae bacterium]|nr:aliphatic sulfonate ABC transporter substrate-binding protein [Propionibacteriaceae bacterium]
MQGQITRRAILGGLAGLGLTAGLTACGQSGSSGGAKKVSIGYIGDYNGAALFAIAAEKKLWDAQGLAPDLKVFNNGPLQIQALGTGDLQFGYIGPGAMWLPASGKAQVCAINSVGNADRLIAQAGISSVADLKGKKIGIPEGTSGDMITQLALEKAGMSYADVEKVVMDPPTIVSAFSAKQIDAAGIWYPMISNIKQQVPDLVELAKNEDFKDKMAFASAFVMQQGLGDKDKDLVIKVLKVLRAANDFRASNPDDAVQLTAKMLKLDAAKVAEDAKNVTQMPSSELDKLTTDGTISTWLDSLDKFYIASGKLKQAEAVTPKKYYTGDLYLEAGK